MGFSVYLRVILGMWDKSSSTMKSSPRSNEIAAAMGGFNFILASARISLYNPVEVSIIAEN